MYLFGKPQDLLFESTNKIRRICTQSRALVSVGAVGAMAPTLFGNIGIGTHTFWENFTEAIYDVMKQLLLLINSL